MLIGIGECMLDYMYSCDNVSASEYILTILWIYILYAYDDD